MPKSNRKRNIIIGSGVVALLLVVFIVVLTLPRTRASNITQLSQTINGGTLAIDIKDENRASVASPSFSMGATSLSFDCQTTTGAIGSNTQRLYVDNPDVADNGWTLTIAATAGASALWQNTGNTQNYDFNDTAGSGCSDGGDADAMTGSMTIDANAGTLTADCGSCATTNITKGSSASFDQGVTDSITLLNAASGSSDIGRWYLTNVGINQTIPGEQPVDGYNINLTATITAS